MIECTLRRYKKVAIFVDHWNGQAFLAIGPPREKGHHHYLSGYALDPDEARKVACLLAQAADIAEGITSPDEAATNGSAPSAPSSKKGEG